MHEPDDKMLVARALEGDRDAFAELYRRYSGHVFRYLRRRLRLDPHAAKDLSSEVFAKALLRLHQYRQHGSFRSWLLAIARHELLNWTSRESVRALGERELRPRAVDVETQALRSQLVSRTILRVRRWPELKQRVFFLVAVAGIDQREVARLTGLTHVAIRAMYSRMRREIRALLALEHDAGES